MSGLTRCVGIHDNLVGLHEKEENDLSFMCVILQKTAKLKITILNFIGKVYVKGDAGKILDNF